MKKTFFLHFEKSHWTSGVLIELIKMCTGSGSSGRLSGSDNGRKLIGKNSANGILRKSSAFLASLTNSGVKKCNDHKGSLLEASDKDKPRFSLLKRNAQLVASFRDEDLHGLRRSPSCQNLSNSGKKKNSTRVGVKKSVSFSSDTSFEEKRTPFRKTAVHEAKVYKKGVLRGTFFTLSFCNNILRFFQYFSSSK